MGFKAIFDCLTYCWVFWLRAWLCTCRFFFGVFVLLRLLSFCFEFYRLCGLCAVFVGLISSILFVCCCLLDFELWFIICTLLFDFNDLIVLDILGFMFWVLLLRFA